LRPPKPVPAGAVAGERVIGVHLKRLANHCVALGLVGFGLDFQDQIVHLGIAIRAKVELASPLVIHTAHQRIERVVRIIGGWGPAKHVEARVTLQNLRKVGPFGFGLKIDLDVDTSEVGSDRLADLTIVDITIVRAVHADLKTVGVSGLCHEFLGPLEVEGHPFVEIRSEPRDSGRNHQPGRCCAPRITVRLMVSISIAW